MLRLIEHGSAWPAVLQIAKCAYLAKTPDFSGDPLKYRGLMVSSVIYRLWARLRLRQANAWCRAWAAPQMFAGVPGRGAAEAWYGTALQNETTQLKGGLLIYTTLDVYKAFDQINRALVYALAAAAGLDHGVLSGYPSFMDNAQ
eukprot:7980824-Alexandrium_andersonii.AAC.1